MTRAAGTFTVASWTRAPTAARRVQVKLTKASVTFAMDGDITGHAAWDAVMCYRPDGTAVYTGIQYDRQAR